MDGNAHQGQVQGEQIAMKAKDIMAEDQGGPGPGGDVNAQDSLEAPLGEGNQVEGGDGAGPAEAVPEIQAAPEVRKMMSLFCLRAVGVVHLRIAVVSFIQ